MLMSNQQRCNRTWNQNQPRIVKPPTIPLKDGTSNSVCWQTKWARIICHGCYVNDSHILSECNHSLNGPKFIIRNYEALSGYDKARALDEYYVNAKTVVGGTAEHALAPEVQEKSTARPKK